MNNLQDKEEDKEGLENQEKPTKRGKKRNTPEESQEINNPESNYIDSDSKDIAKSLTQLLSVPTERVQTEEQTTQSKSDVLEGFGSSDNSFKEESDDETDYAETLNDDEGGALFEDSDLMAEIGVELIDMLMTYGAMAIAKDWDNEKKYMIKKERKKRLQEPLAKLLENRDVKASPELVFAFMIVVSYSPVMIMAYQERQRKSKIKKGSPVKTSVGIESESRASILNDDNLNVEPQRQEEMESPEDEDAMAEMMSKMKPKRTKGRPVGGTDLKPRQALSESDREKEIQKAKALRKDGYSFSRIAKELNVSEATATRWVRS